MRLFFKVENGFDPVDPEYASRYASREWQLCDKGNVEGTLDDIERRLGSLSDLRVLDMGAGPGQYTVAFALRGAFVTWHDPSRAYMRIAQEHAEASGVRCFWSLGFLEAASRFQGQPFDLVFCRGCWKYCVSDAAFARLMLKLTKPGGAAWIYANTADWHQRKYPSDSGLVTKSFKFVYMRSGLKLRYFMPPPGRVSSLLLRCGCVSHLEFDYTKDGSELIWLRRQAAFDN
jgi:SAM-dependent methyltransferase